MKATRRSDPILLLVLVGLVCFCGPMMMLIESNVVGALLESRPGAALVKAAQRGDIPAAEEALRQGADVNYKLVELGTTPMQGALSNGNYELALLLAKRGAKVKVEFDLGHVGKPPPEIVRRLIAAEREFAMRR